MNATPTSMRRKEALVSLENKASVNIRMLANQRQDARSGPRAPSATGAANVCELYRADADGTEQGAAYLRKGVIAQNCVAIDLSEQHEAGGQNALDARVPKAQASPKN